MMRAHPDYGVELTHGDLLGAFHRRHHLLLVLHSKYVREEHKPNNRSNKLNQRVYALPFLQSILFWYRCKTVVF